MPIKRHGGGGASVLTGDAAVGNVLADKTFYKDDPASKLTGTMTNQGAVSTDISAKATEVTIAAGYHSGSGKVKIATAEQDKIIAGNIKSGVTLLGVAGSLAAGVDTSDATAVAGHIMTGFTAYGAAGTKLTGTQNPGKLYPIADTYVNAADPTVNYGTADQVGHLGTAGNEKRSFIKFDISKIPTTGLVKAELFMYLYANDISDRPQRPCVKRVTADWVEGDVTWNAQPTFDGSGTRTGGSYGLLAHVNTNDGTINMWRCCDITTMVSEWLAATYANYGLCIDHTYGEIVDGGGWADMYYRSRHYATVALRPFLLLTY